MKIKVLIMVPIMLCINVILFSNDVFATEEKNIVYFFNRSTEARNNMMKIQKVNDKWQIVSTNVGVIDKSIIDIKNGFIYYKWISGDGDYDIYYAIYKANNAKTYVGYSEYCRLYESAMKFYQIENGHFIEVTDKVMPKFDIRLWFRKNYNFNKANDLIKKNIENSSLNEIFKKRLIYRLPRYGTTINVILDKSNLLSDSLVRDVVRKNKTAFNEMMNNIQYNEFSLIWDMEKGQFKIGGIR